MKNNNINHGILPKKCRIFASMKSKIIIAILTLCICSCQYKSTHTSYGSPQNQVVKGTKLIGTTPVKDQGKSPLCWAYAMLATIESEHIMQGDSVNLSVAYVARMMLQEKAIEYYFSKGTKPISMRGMAPMLIHYINKYGAVPYDSYEDKKDVDMRVLCRKVEFLCRNAIAQQVGIEELKNRLNQLLDTNMGQDSIYARRRIYPKRICQQRMLPWRVCGAHQFHTPSVRREVRLGNARQPDRRKVS